MNRDNFLRFISASGVWRDLGFDDLNVLTHAWHETGGFAKVIGMNNYWGLKVPTKRSWTGIAVVVPTTEFNKKAPGETPEQAVARLSKVYGVAVRVSEASSFHWKVSLPQTFRDWARPDDALSTYCEFVRLNYPAAYDARADKGIAYFAGFVKTLKWATDPNYVRSLTRLKNDLTHDNAVLEALANETLSPRVRNL